MIMETPDVEIHIETRAYNDWLGRRVRELRRDSGYTLKEFAALLPGSPHFTTISKLEKGQIPVTPEWVDKIATLLGITPLQLANPTMANIRQLVPGKLGIFGVDDFSEEGFPATNPRGWAPSLGASPNSFAVQIAEPNADPEFYFEPWVVAVDPDRKALFDQRYYVIVLPNQRVFRLAIFLNSPARFKLWPDGEILNVAFAEFRLLGTAEFQSRMLHVEKFAE